jgi:hypothetical protein
MIRLEVTGFGDAHLAEQIVDVVFEIAVGLAVLDVRVQVVREFALNVDVLQPAGLERAVRDPLLDFGIQLVTDIDVEARRAVTELPYLRKKVLELVLEAMRDLEGLYQLQRFVFCRGILQVRS